MTIFLFLGISLFQCPTVANMGLPQEKLTLARMEITEKYELPNDYAIVPSVAFKKQNVSMPEVTNPTVKIEGNLNKAMAQEKRWLDRAMMLMEKKEVEENDNIAWSAYHASQEDPSDTVFPALTQLMPLFYEKAASAAMIKHGIDMLKKPHNF